LTPQQIQHPTAALIARTATSQDDITGDGTTSNVLLIGELLKQSSRFLSEGLHPRAIIEGLDVAKEEALRVLESFKVKKDVLDTELLRSVARTSLRTKLQGQIADQVRIPFLDGYIRSRGRHLLKISLIIIITTTTTTTNSDRGYVC